MEKDKKELFTSPRWHEDVGAVSVGHEKMTKEEKEKAKKEFDKILRERGIKQLLIF